MKHGEVCKVIVESYSGFKGEERPTAFMYLGRTFRIKEILSQWVEQGPHAGQGSKWYYRVKTEDNQSYQIVYHGHNQEWYLEEHH